MQLLGHSSRRWPGQKLANGPSTQSLTNKHVYCTRGAEICSAPGKSSFRPNFAAAFWWLIAVNASLYGARQTRSWWIGPRQRGRGPRQICIMHSGAKMLYCSCDLISFLRALWRRLGCVTSVLQPALCWGGNKFLNIKKSRAPLCTFFLSQHIHFMQPFSLRRTRRGAAFCKKLISSASVFHD